MSVFGRFTRALALVAGLAGPGLAAPERVVSINLCTDQLALALAAPGQLISVTQMAQDPASSPMHAVASALPGNMGRAEEIYLMAPDLVLAGTFTAPATIHMLQGLGIPVLQFAPANALSDIPARLRQMGAALGREAEAEEMAAAFEARVAALPVSQAPRPRAALLYVNAFAAGPGSLAGDLLAAAGFDNVAAEAGLGQTGKLSVEEVVLLAPDVIIRGQDYQGRARAEANLAHPALAATGAPVVGGIVDRNWICGGPSVLAALDALTALRDRMEAGR